MPIPSLYRSDNGARPWSVARATAYGAAIGLLTATFRVFGPLRESGTGTSSFLHIAGAVLGFALLCAVAAALRNFIARRLVWTHMR
jgi:hypothetical protein